MTKHKPRPYHVLAERIDGRWTFQFGDRDRECVVFERQDLRDHGTRASDLKVVRADSARQSDVDFAIRLLNIVPVQAAA